MTKEQIINLIDIIKSQMLENNREHYQIEIQSVYAEVHDYDQEEIKVDGIRKQKNFDKEKIIAICTDLERMVK